MTWALPDEVLASLAMRLAELAPDVAVEAGSGRSTAVLATYARRVVSLEHHRRFATDTLSGLGGLGNVDLRCVPLVEIDTPAGRYRWYDTDLPETIGFALIDGPPAATVGRQAAGFAILPRMAPDGEVWLDDAQRDHERGCLALWTAHLPVTVSEHPIHPRIAVLRMYTPS